MTRWRGTLRFSGCVAQALDFAVTVIDSRQVFA